MVPRTLLFVSFVASALAAVAGWTIFASGSGSEAALPLLWPPAGLALAFALFLGWRGAIAAGLGVVAGSLAAVPTASTAVLLGLSTVAEAGIGAHLLRRWIDPRAGLESTRDSIALLAIGAGLVPLPFAVAAAFFAADHPALAVAAGFERIVRRLWVGDALAVAAFTPLVLSWLGAHESLSTRRTLTAIATAVPLWLLTTLSFLQDFQDSPLLSLLTVATLPGRVWVATQFPLTVTTALNAAFLSTAMFGASRGLGPLLLRGGPVESVFGLQLTALFLAATMLGLCQTAGARRRSQALRRQLEHRFVRLTENLGEAVWFSRQGRGGVFPANAALERITGLPAARLQGEPFPWLEVVHPGDRERLERAFSRWRLSGAREHLEVEHRLVRPDGALRWARSRMITIEEDGQDVFAGVLEDVTERRLLVEQLERAARLRSDFVATMSHELRTPLNVVLGYLAMLSDGEFGSLAPDQREVLARVEQSARELLQLVSNTLDMSQLESGRASVRQEAVDLRAVLREVEDQTRLLRAEKPAIRFSVRVEPGAEAVETDRAKLAVIVKNLVGNALKYTREGRIEVVARPARGRGVEVAVRDTGIGIPDGMMETVFEPFRQLGQEASASSEGVGLGLYISRRFATMLGGTLGGHPVPGGGTEFVLLLPPRGGAGSLPARSC